MIIVSARDQIMLSMCTKFHENTFDGFNVIDGMRFPNKSGCNCQFKITKGHNSMRNVGAYKVFVLCIPFDDGLYLNRNL